MIERAGPYPVRRLSLPFWGSLSFRLAALLTVALLPLGLIAVWQTARLERNLDEVYDLTAIALTARAANTDREVIESAFGAAMGLAAVVPEMRDDPELCRETFRRFLDRADESFALAGFIEISGHSTCSSAEGPLYFGDDPDFQAIVAEARRDVIALRSGPVTGASAILASQPVRGSDGRLTGFVSVSIPHHRLNPPPSNPVSGREMDLFTINRHGEILTATAELDVAAGWMPADREASDLVGGPRRFTARNANGAMRAFSVVPVVDGTVYAVGSWQPQSNGDRPMLDRILASPALFPVLMWLASLVLVFLAVDRQVVRHVKVIAAQMRRFGRDRTLPSPTPRTRMPSEVAAISEEFAALASRLLQDEAGLMDAMHDKDVLLKEVHHRVKNNLQLISSIINMQIRHSGNGATNAALTSVNRRVTGMATVHRRLYQAENLGRVRADELLRDVVAPLADLAPPGRPRPRVEMHLDPVVLYPDQAVPVALLTVEAVTNALKYLQPDAGGDSWLRVCLEDHGDGRVRIATESSMAPDASLSEDAADAQEAGSGLGSRLIMAFARQLESSVETEPGPDVYRLSVVFETQPFDAEAPDAPPEPA